MTARPATLAEAVAAHLEERRAAGISDGTLLKDERGLAALCERHRAMGCPEGTLPRELVEDHCALRPGEAESNRQGRVSMVRGLALFMVRSGLDAHVPSADLRGRATAYVPHVFTDDEVASLLAAAESLAGPDPAGRRAQASLVLRLLYSTGMRSGEACSLGKGDVDLDARVLTVRHAKNDRERYVPLCESVADRMGRFRLAAELSHPQYCRHGLFWSLPEGRPLTTGYVYGFFRAALRGAGIPHGGRGKGPRVHDLRFTFACHRLRAWARDGADVSALLPVLATYMGHADTRCTEYYLRLTAESLPGLVDQVEGECGWVVPS